VGVDRQSRPPWHPVPESLSHSSTLKNPSKSGPISPVARRRRADDPTS